VNIAVVTSYFPRGENSYRGHSAFHTLKRLADYGVSVEVICPVVNYPWTTSSDAIRFDRSYRYGPIQAVYTKYPAIPGFSRPVNGWSCLRGLRPILMKSKPDAILNYWLYPEGFSAVCAGRELGVPVIVGALGSDLCRISDPFTRHFVSRTVREATAVLAVSEDLRRRAIVFGAAPEKVRTILNGCDHSLFHPGNPQEARRRVGYDGPPGGKLILFVGNLLRSKGLAELVSAFASLSHHRPQSRLALIGEGPFAATLGQLADAAGVRGRVMFLHRQPSAVVAEWMRAADLFCLPSYSEGCPNAVVEALACGKPVVATNVGGIPELVQEDSGILIPARNEIMLAKAIEQALCRTWKRERPGRTPGRTWEDAAAETYALCRDVVHASRFVPEDVGFLSSCR
jgi:teichuronic acid biosynthesis glycosyltransferase TuaC